MTDSSHDQRLKDTQEYFKAVQSYNTTVITVGYATFFGLLFFLQKEGTKSPLIFWACLCLALSAGIFVLYELINQIKLAWSASKTGEKDKRFCRFWAFFFIPSVILATLGAAILVYLFLCNLRT